LLILKVVSAAEAATLVAMLIPSSIPAWNNGKENFFILALIGY
jgi:hypothetical protein